MILAVLVALATISAPAAAQAEEPEEQITVDVNQDGSAEMQFHFTYNLSDSQSKEAFEDLNTDEEAQASLESDFKSGLVSVADSAENKTGREMSINDVSSEFKTSDSGETGVVVLTATYDGFAAVEDDQLVVTEPFASGYSADMPVTINAPEGYTINSVTPEAAEQSESSVAWETGDSLEGMQVTMSADEAGQTDSSNESAVSTPGLGAIIALTAISVAALLARHRD